MKCHICDMDNDLYSCNHYNKTPAIEILQKRIKHMDEYVLSEDDMSIFVKTKIHFFTSTLIKAVVEFSDNNCNGFTIQDNVI